MLNAVSGESRFSGKERADREPYYRARYYEPRVGRFLSEDPLRFLGGDLVFYGYTLNGPTNFGDPSGLSGPGAAAATAAAAASSAGPALQVIQGGAGATVGLSATLGTAVETGSAGGPIGALVAVNLALLGYNAYQGYSLGVAYGWWGPHPSQAALNAAGTEKAQQAKARCEKKDESGDDGCSKEWQNAYRQCSYWFSQISPPRGMTGGYTNLQDCARGFVSQRCGGNRVK